MGSSGSSSGRRVFPVRPGWIARLGAVLSELADIGLAFAELIADRVMRPTGPVDLNREIALFTRVSMLVCKMTAYKWWLKLGGVPNMAAVEARQAKRAAQADAAEPSKDAGDDAGDARYIALGREIEDQQAAFRAWFSQRTTAEVMESFRRELVSIARALGHDDKAARITTIVQGIVASLGDVGGGEPAAADGPSPARAGERRAATELVDSG